jgi:hypothetical protein
MIDKYRFCNIMFAWFVTLTWLISKLITQIWEVFFFENVHARSISIHLKILKKYKGQDQQKFNVWQKTKFAYLVCTLSALNHVNSIICSWNKNVIHVYYLVFQVFDNFCPHNFCNNLHNWCQMTETFWSFYLTSP